MVEDAQNGARLVVIAGSADAVETVRERLRQHLETVQTRHAEQGAAASTETPAAD